MFASGAAALVAGVRSPRRRARRSRLKRCPGLGWACGLAGEGLRGARDPLVASARGDGDRTWLRDCDDGTGWRGTPEYGVRAARGGYGLH